MSLLLGYGTNGFGDHRLPDALAVIAELGYDGASLTLDHPHLDPFADDVVTQVAGAARLLERHGLRVVLETGARFLLDPWRKHEPTLVSAQGRERRLDLLHRAIDIATDLGTDVVHLWSGILPPDTPVQVGWERLLTGLADVLPHAERAGVHLAFEPEPGMFIERIADARELRTRLGSPAALQLTLDVGHLVCNEDDTPESCIRSVGEVLAHVQIEDMRRGVHEHLEFGEGELSLPPVLAALMSAEYSGLVSVELARHSHAAPTVARRSLEALRAGMSAAGDLTSYQPPSDRHEEMS